MKKKEIYLKMFFLLLLLLLFRTKIRKGTIGCDEGIQKMTGTFENINKNDKQVSLCRGGPLGACERVKNGGTCTAKVCTKTIGGSLSIFSVGYTMRDIRYKWNEGPNSVGVSNEVSLPQFKVLGHRQRAMEISLTTGNVLVRL